ARGLGSWCSSPAFGLRSTSLPLLFPTGHLASPRWRILAGAVIVGLTIGSIQTATAPGPMNSASGIDNPVHIPDPLLGWIQTVGAVSALFAPPSFLIAVGG